MAPLWLEQLREKGRPTTGPRIIAFCGPKECGKDTVAAGLRELNWSTGSQGLSYPFFARTPFARGVKQICHDVFGWSWEDMDDAVFKATPTLEWPFVAPRWPMMDIANYMRDKYGPDVWVNTNARTIANLERESPYGCYLIPDLRFPNELEWLKKQNAFLVYVERDVAERKLAAAKERGDEMALNSSESHYDLLKSEADYILSNNGQIYEARNDIKLAVRARFEHWHYWNIQPRKKVA